MELSPESVALLKHFEGYRSRVYLDAVGFPTVGYGHRLLHPDSFPNGLDEPQALDILVHDVRDAEQAVKRLVKVTLTQGQFDALVDFVFNLGQGKLAASTLLKDLNAGQYEDAAAQLLRWDHAGAKENSNLKERRAAEFRVWHGKPWNMASA
jgi:lysozyme